MPRQSAKLMILILLFLFTFSSLHAQSPMTLQCGQIIEAELTSKVNVHSYTIQVSAGTTLKIRIEPIGGSLNPVIALFDSSSNLISAMNIQVEGLAEELNDIVVSSSNPIILIGGARKGHNSSNWNPLYNSSETLGAYTLYIGCTLRDGTVINPGDTAPAPNQNGGNTNVPVSPTFSGTGFPGLAPVDFSAVAKIPMIANVPMTGGVAPDGSTILGYTVDANANDTLALGFSRLSGNLNLGLVVLSSDNKVVFQASLVTSSELTTKFTLPSAGTYTIGIFRIDLLPPAAPEATAFQLTATLNP